MLRRDVLKGIAAAGAATRGRNAPRSRAGCHQDRRLPVADRRLPDRRPPGARRRQALHAAQRRQGRRQEDRADRARGLGRAGRGAPRRAGDDRQREGQHRARRHHADRARDQPARDAGQDPDRGDHLGRIDHGRPLALHGAHQLHARPVLDDHGRLGGQERQQEGRLAGQRLGAGRGGRDRVRRTRSRPAAGR